MLEAGIAEMTALAGQPAEVILGAGVSASVTADAISQLVDELEVSIQSPVRNFRWST